MKIYPNTLCPCESGKKYKDCCLNKKLIKTGMIGSSPAYKFDKNVDFIVNPRGAVQFMDESKQPVLEIPDGSITKYVLSVGSNHNDTPIAIIQDDEGPICYLLPNWYLGWCRTCVGMAMCGMHVFPSNVMFSLINGKYSADIL